VDEERFGAGSNRRACEEAASRRAHLAEVRQGADPGPAGTRGFCALARAGGCGFMGGAGFAAWGRDLVD
jgi:hypothetical protein